MEGKKKILQDPPKRRLGRIYQRRKAASDRTICGAAARFPSQSARWGGWVGPSGSSGGGRGAGLWTRGRARLLPPCAGPGAPPEAPFGRRLRLPELIYPLTRMSAG